MMKPFIIAEAASTHEGSLDKALALISVAHAAGAQAVKFQFWSSPERMRERRRIPAPAYDQGSIHVDWLEPLKKTCHNVGLLFSASVFLPEDIATLASHIDYWKVSSFEARDRTLTQNIPRDHRLLFVSTGMMEEHELSYVPKRAIRLHCTSAYPCPPNEANLGAIERGHGFSDHSRFFLTGAFAVSAGADYLEVHYRLQETSRECSDFLVSLDPDGLAQYVSLARVAYQMRGSGKKGPQQSERENIAYRVTS